MIDDEGSRDVRPRGVVHVEALPIDDIRFDEAVAEIVGLARRRAGGYVCTPNVDYIVRARRDHAFREAVLNARLRIPDGMGIVYGSRLSGRPLRGSVTGRLLPEAIAQEAGDVAIGLLGGSPGAGARAAERLRRAGGHVVAAIEPPMGFRIGGPDDETAVAALRAQPPDLLFVGLGSPKQDYWMLRHQPELPTTVMVGIGAGIDVVAGVQPRPPAWMTRVGAEWAFRLVHDPRRLARRYLWDDPRFFAWMLRARLSRTAREHETG